MAFRHPETILTAWRVEDVRACLEEADAAAQAGAYAVGFVAYEAAGAFGLPTRAPAPGLPLVYLAIFRGPPAPVGAPSADPSATPLAWAPTIDRDDYESAIQRIKDYIADGDTYQLNFTFRLRTVFRNGPDALFRSLVAAQQGAWSMFLETGTHAICSASPELFFLREGGRIESRPMKGTAARALASSADGDASIALRESPKNRSENVMIVDLVRNDLGRIAATGTVTVPSLFDVERYPQQWQMTSTVTADIGHRSVVEIFEATFPSGSVTGAPKRRSMEILRNLETTPRGVYTGAMGVIAPGGRAHFNVAIRTVVVDRASGVAEFGVGSGVVWDSTPRGEYDECMVKAAILTARLPEFDLLETLRWDPNEGYSLHAAHLARIRESADYFGRPCPVDALEAALHAAVAARTSPAKVRLLLSADGRSRCEVAELVPAGIPVRLELANAPVSARDVFLFHKTTNRQLFERMRASHPKAGSVLLWNEAGEITEALEANVVLDMDGVLVTPPVRCGLLQERSGQRFSHAARS